LHRKIASADSTSPGRIGATCAPNGASSAARQVPATPQRSTGGVVQAPSRSTNRLAAVADTTLPSMSCTSASSVPARSHSARASTCSSRLQCLIPASAGWIASRVPHQCNDRPAASAGGNAWREMIQAGSAAGSGA
jgi:hypothetical protein